MSRTHVVISGTGRAGTSFLVQLLTHLGLDTGYSLDTMKMFVQARAGLEHDIREENAPYIVKNPYFCDYAEDILQNRKDILIEHVFIPIRDLHAAAESRRYVTEKVRSQLTQAEWNKAEESGLPVPGGLWGTKDNNQQEVILLVKLYKLALALADSEIPVTLMHYPRIVKDSSYLYAKLKPILKTITYTQFESAFTKIVRPKLVHSFNKKDS